MFGCSYLERRTEEKAQKVMRESIKRRVVKFEKLISSNSCSSERKYISLIFDLGLGTAPMLIVFLSQLFDGQLSDVTPTVVVVT